MRGSGFTRHWSDRRRRKDAELPAWPQRARKEARGRGGRPLKALHKYLLWRKKVAPLQSVGRGTRDEYFHGNVQDDGAALTQNTARGTGKSRGEKKEENCRYTAKISMGRLMSLASGAGRRRETRHQDRQGEAKQEEKQRFPVEDTTFALL
ncbi:hypothetical protein E2C01_050666 [Portunus trituberculatus]|uniref:Uncharacterized protein n=1 Tax=Portunus trituberculatus TaxID=210409 RepID=A0A5B7G9K9_PORTR|nr:hypothetical protein [Portunus trituberculatus]